MRFVSRKIILLHLIFALLLIPTLMVQAEQKKVPTTQDQVVRKRVAELESKLKVQSEQLTSLRTEINTTLERHEAQVQGLHRSAQNQIEEVRELKRQNANNSELSSEGAVILLVGLLIEILGALLLGAPVLATKVEELNDFDIDAGLDMALHAPKKDAVLGFYSMVGHILLILGFSAQFAGTAIVLSVGWGKLALIVLGGLLFSLIILYRILGFDPTQSRKQKIFVIWKNVTRASKLKISWFFLRGRECEICLKRVKKEQSYIFWYDEGNSSNFPYLHSPHQFTVGHKNCMDQKISDKIASQKNYEYREKIKPHLHMMSGKDFITQHFDGYKKWFVGSYDEWSKKRADTPKLSKQEIALDIAVEKIKKIEA